MDAQFTEIVAFNNPVHLKATLNELIKYFIGFVRATVVEEHKA